MNSTTPLSPEKQSRGGRKHALIAVVALIAVGLSAVAGSRGVHSDWVYRMVEMQADPVNGLQSSSGVDVVTHKDQVWIGSSGGVSFTPDRGASWFTHTDQTGLNANNISALLSTGSSPNDTIWVAAVVTEIINDAPIRSGTGLQFSVDGGANWQTPMDLGGIMDSGTVGPFRITFDLAADTQRIFAANWAGGLIGSDDGGVSWKRFHATAEDADWWQNFNGAPPLSGLYFSVLADTGHTDTVIIWAGSACGIVRWDFVEPHIKPSATRILDYAYSVADSLVFLAGETGLSSAEIWRIDTIITIDDTTSPPTIFYDTTIDTAAFYHNWNSLYAADGLFGATVTQVHFFGGRLFTVLSDSVGGSTQRFLTLSPDLDPLSIQEIFGGAIDSLFTIDGANVFDFEDFGDRYLYLAAGPAGLFVSVDSGFSWSAVTVDPNTAAGNGRNNVYTLAGDSLGNLWCGTDSGVVKLY
ncbi:MAG TPA: hypothetical protein VLB27_04045, partial [candidate division Zixibacteria bacterium]|nr:hypothetical protein [candidate division Zixibacteria bacterium]